MPNEALRLFFNSMAEQWIMLTYGDVRLRTRYSDFLPKDTDVSTRFSRHIPLKTPIVSSPMDTVTTAEMAIAMAEAGGLGIIHRNLSPIEQAKAAGRVKHRLNGRINTPITIEDTMGVKEVLQDLNDKQYPFQTFPVMNSKGRMVGLITRNDFDVWDGHSALVSSIMTPLQDLTVATEHATARDCFELMRRTKKKVLPLMRADVLTGMYVFSDLQRIFSQMPTHHNLDQNGQLLVGAAIGTGDEALLRADLLARKKCDVFQIDTAHGDSKNVIDTVRRLKHAYPNIDVVAGNVSNGDAAKRLVDAGADGVVVGQGPGSICTTRVIAGVGMPQVSAVFECARALEGTDVPVCADGGIDNSGDMVIALAVGAQCVMLGRLLAGTDEAPGEKRMFEGRLIKDYRGMGSLGAMREGLASRQKYGQAAQPIGKVVPEGVEGVVPYIGSVQTVLEQYVGGIRAGMGYTGSETIVDLQANASLFRITSAGLHESHPHDIEITASAPNYYGRN